MKAIHQLIAFFEARGRVSNAQKELLIQKGYYIAHTEFDIGKFQGSIGMSFCVEATGSKHGSVWGTKIYTSDSCLGTACVHAGVLKENETGVVKVTIVQPLQKFKGSVRNGVTSRDWDSYPGAYKVEAV